MLLKWMSKFKAFISPYGHSWLLSCHSQNSRCYMFIFFNHPIAKGFKQKLIINTILIELALSFVKFLIQLVTFVRVLIELSISNLFFWEALSVLPLGPSTPPYWTPGSMTSANQTPLDTENLSYA